MLKQTFIHIPGIGPKTEKKIWRRGIFTWQDFITKKRYSRSLAKKVERIKKYLRESERALKKKDVLFFAETLPKAEFWRLYPEFKDKTAFLDIETTGLSPYYNQITLVSLFDGRDLKFFMDGINLRELPRELAKYSIIITFNGTWFDIPFLKYKFPNIKIPPLHIDLRYVLRRLGYTGGLKKIENDLSIKREKDVALQSYYAAVFWNAFIRKFDLDSLELLIRYNIADVLNLQRLFHIAHNKLIQKNGCKKAGRLGTLLTRNNFKPRVKARGGKLHIHFDSKMHYQVNPKHYKQHFMSVDTLLLRYFSGIPKVVGIDLKSSEERNSGYALLEGNNATTQLVKTDEEIVDLILRDQPLLVSIDSPLGLPKGRDCMKENCKCRKFGIIRECEKILLSRKVPVYSCLLPSMKPLTKRGMRLAKTIRDLGFEVIESYPGAAQDILHITRKKIDVQELKESLGQFGLTGEFLESRPNHDELDAITSALVGYFYLSDNYEALGNNQEELLIVPLIAPVKPR